MTLQIQFITLLLMVVSGFVIGLFFDGYRVLKGKLAFPSWLVFFIDIIYGGLSGIFIFMLLVWINHGQLRITIYLFFLFGLGIYYYTLSLVIIKFWVMLYELIFQLIILIVRIIHVFIIVPIIYLYKLSSWVIMMLITIVLFSFQFLQKIILFFGRFFYSPVKKQTNKIKSKFGKKEGFLGRLTNLFKKVK